MSEVVLTLRGPLPARVDLSPLVPDRLAAVAPADVARLTLRFEHGEPIDTGDLFTVSGTASDLIRLVGDLSQADGIGHGMTSGSIAIDGSAGRRLGQRMNGGSIEVSGNAGDGVGREMAGGRIVVRGHVGRGTGGASPGAKRGMTGGEIVVFGDAAAETGARMRRGLIAVAGDVGPDAARTAIAGTVVIGGTATGPPGRWSKRGTVVALGPAAIPSTYRYACTYRPPVVALILTHLRKTYGFPVTADDAAAAFDRYSGDLAESDRGEILVRSRRRLP